MGANYIEHGGFKDTIIETRMGTSMENEKETAI